MARLKVKLNGKVVSEINLDPDRPIIGGRKEDCDILLQSEKGISREHFQIQNQEGQWRLDVLSRFGDVIVDGQKIESIELNDGMIFLVPPYVFEFRTTEDVETAPAPTHTPVPLDPDSEPPMVSAPVVYDDDKTYVPPKTSQYVAQLKILDAQRNLKTEIRIDSDETYLAGRESNCQIHIDDQRVSRRQFEIKKINGQYTITDLGSVNGTYLNGAMLVQNEPTPLRSGDVIMVLDNQMVFELHDPNFQNLVQQAQVHLPVESQFPPVQQPMAAYPGMAPGPIPGYSAPQPQVKKFDLKDRNTQIRLAIGVLALVVIGGALMEPSETSKDKKAATQNAADPLAKLNQEQKMMVKHYYQLAESYLAQQKWMLAKGEIEKIKELVPNYQDYERAKELEAHAEQGILNEQEISKIEQQQQMMALQEEKIQLQVAECRKLVNPNVNREEVEGCIQPVLQFNPEHPQIQQLRFEVDQIVTQRMISEEQRKELDRQAEALRKLFSVAEQQEKKGDYVSAIRSFEKVAKSSLPDRGNYRSRAQRQIATLKEQMSAKTEALMSEAQKNAEQQNYKIAIMTLRQAKKIDPTNDEIDELIKKYTNDLKKAMLVLFQEGILEEGFGNIEGGDGKPGAKDKWKKILELDIPEGEYYKKARQRLRKYGGG